MNQFILCCYNTLSYKYEINDMQIMNSLLQLFMYYIWNYNFIQVNFWWLKCYVHMIIESIESLNDNSSDFITEEQCIFQSDNAAFINHFDNYKWCDLELADLIFFKYCMLMQVKTSNDNIAFNIKFNFKHSKNHIHIQYLICFESQIKTVSFNNQIFLYQIKKKSIQENYSMTNAIKNNLAEMLLRFFVF